MILASAVVLVVAATVLFTLFVREQDVPPPEPVSPTRHLEERRSAIYENLRDLQFEYRVGKLSDADYQQTKLGLQKELAVVIAEIEKLAPPKAAAAAATKKEPAKPKTPQPGTVCPHCQATFPNPMKFCGECGKPMA
jgi:rRNA maturation endonuclease Nob1